MTNKKVYVIVVIYNGMKWIDKCFSSLLNSSIPIYIIAIDNASTDNSCSFIKENFKNVELIETGSNWGFSKANNIGLGKAIKEKADYVFLLNQDAWVEKDCIEKLIAHYEQNKTFSLLSPFHFNYDKLGLEYYFEEYVLKQYTKEFHNDLNSGNQSKIYETQFVHAAAWLMPINTIKIVGGFDPLFRHTGEDNDFIQRLQYKGFKVGILNDAVIYHKGTNAGLIDSKNNYLLNFNTIMLKLKNPNASVIGAFCLFYSNSISYFVKNLFKKRSQLSSIQNKIFFYVLKYFFKIISSRKEQKRGEAYLKQITQHFYRQP